MMDGLAPPFRDAYVMLMPLRTKILTFALAITFMM